MKKEAGEAIYLTLAICCASGASVRTVQRAPKGTSKETSTCYIYLSEHVLTLDLGCCLMEAIRAIGILH